MIGPARLGELTAQRRTLVSVASYDRHARAYQQAHRRARPLADARWFAQLAGQGALVLDVGCGPASDLRLLRDQGLKPLGVDLSFGALTEARLLMPRHPLVQAPYERLPFRIRVFGGLWMSGAFVHLPRAAWRPTFARLLTYLDAGPVYFSCVRGQGDLQPVNDPVLGRIYRSDATEDEIGQLLGSHRLNDVRVQARPDLLPERNRTWVVGRGWLR